LRQISVDIEGYEIKKYLKLTKKVKKEVFGNKSDDKSVVL